MVQQYLKSTNQNSNGGKLCRKRDGNMEFMGFFMFLCINLRNTTVSVSLLPCTYLNMFRCLLLALCFTFITIYSLNLLLLHFVRLFFSQYTNFFTPARHKNLGFFLCTENVYWVLNTSFLKKQGNNSGLEERQITQLDWRKITLHYCKFLKSWFTLEIGRNDFSAQKIFLPNMHRSAHG